MDGGKQQGRGADRVRSRDAQAFLTARLSRTRTRAPKAAKIPSTDRLGPLPLSFAQQRVWFLQELAPGNPFYNIPLAVPLNGAIDPAVVELALNMIVERHESLRTIFGRRNGVLYQAVQSFKPTALEVVDIAAQGLRAAETQLAVLATAEAETPFDLTTGPVIRGRLVRLAAMRHVLLLTVHHIAADGWSMAVLFREFVAIYEAVQKGTSPDLPDLPIQYGDFAQWQRGMLEGPTLESLLGYWRKQLNGAQDLPLITDYPRPAVASFQGDFLDVRFDRAATKAAAKLGRDHGCTLFQTMLAAYKVVLSRFAGATDVVVGAPIANRAHSGLEPLIGFFVNSLALRTDLSGNPTFTDILARVRDTAVAAYAHQDLPFERLVEDLRPDRDLSRNPLFQVSFQIQNAPGLSDTAGGGEDFRRVERSSAILDLALSLWETPKGLVGGIEYSTDLFERETIACLAQAMQLVVKAAVADPSTTLSQFALLPLRQEARYRRVLQGPKAPRGHTLDRMFAQAVGTHADRTALVDEVGTLSFADLDDLSDRVAQAMASAGIEQGDVIGLAVDRGREFAALMLAVVKLGAAYLPLDTACPPARLAVMAALAQPKIVLIADDAPDYPHGPSGRVGDLLAFAKTCEPLAAPAEIDPEDACYVLFTSGSTGRPKAVEVPHRALANHMAWMQDAFSAGPGDSVLQRTPTHFDAAIWEYWLPLLSGAELCLPPAFHAADARALFDAVARFAPTIVQCVPSLVPHLLAEGDMARASPGLRLFCCGGEPLTREITGKLQAAFPAAKIINLYGPTETTIDATWHILDAQATDPTPIGRPIAGCSLLVVDESGALCPPNMLGELVICGAPVAHGYLGQSDLTHQRFVVPQGSRAPCFLSGDLGWYSPDGTLYCAGRRDRQVKLRGNRIELGEIEAVLQEHDTVGQAAVIVHHDRGEPTLAAFVTLPQADVSAHLRAEAESCAVDDWEALYRVVYAPDASTPTDAHDDFTGWTSSFDGTAIPLNQMQDWADETAARIAALNPRGIFEIGVGSGLILSRLASDRVDYVACDLSAPAIGRLQTWVDAKRPGQVALYVAKAEDAHRLAMGTCDTLVMNSIVQYLPSSAQLREVLVQNAGRMPQNARLFIGDVRPFGLLRAFHTAVETERASKGTSSAELRKRIEAAIAQEKELLLDPDFFRRLDLGDVAVRLKLGQATNELFDYRYDVAIRCGDDRLQAPLNWINWRSGALDMAGLHEAMADYNGPIAVQGIPNARISAAVALSHLIRDPGIDLDRDELRAEAAATAAQGAHPGEIAALADRYGLLAEALPNRDHPDAFDLVIHDSVLDGYSIDAVQPGKGRGGLALSTEPTLRALTARLAPTLHDHMAHHLPSAMRPARLAVLDQLPRLSNGKTDYAALADHLPHEPVRVSDFEAPADALEQLIADVFAAVLGVTRVGVGDDFFVSLGGHSLLATQAIARLREVFGDELPLRHLFEHSTPAALAAQIRHDVPEAETLADDYAAMADMDEAELDALLDPAKGVTDE